MAEGQSKRANEITIERIFLETTNTATPRNQDTMSTNPPLPYCLGLSSGQLQIRRGWWHGLFMTMTTTLLVPDSSFVSFATFSHLFC